MILTNDNLVNPHPIFASSQIRERWGTAAPDTSIDFVRMPVGSKYTYAIAAGHVQEMVKVKNDGAANDWVVKWGCLAYTVLKSAFTDGGSTSGTYDLPQQLPAGAKVNAITVRDIVAFSGDTTATLLVGITGTDTDAFMTGTPSVFTTATFVDFGPPSGDRELEAATTVTLLVTSTADFTNVAATGSVTVFIPYTI